MRDVEDSRRSTYVASGGEGEDALFARYLRVICALFVYIT